MRKTKSVKNQAEELKNDFPFYIMNQFSQFLCGYKEGRFYWSDDITSARVFERHEQFSFISIHEPFQKAEKIYLD